MKKQNKERVLELIKEGKTYKDTSDTLKKESDDTLSGATFYRLKQDVYRSEKMDAALEKCGEKREKRGEEAKKTKRKVAWSTGKQKNADESNLAKLINKGLYHGVFPLCKNKQLKEEDVQDINLGGAVVANVLYFFPDVNLEHPLIVLTTRGILFYIRFKAICSTITQKIEELKSKVVGGDSGIKPEWSEGK